MTKRVIKFDSLANSVAASDQATAQAIEAADQALSTAGVNPDYISYQKGVLPDSTGATEETIGAYFTAEDVLQKIQWDGSEWQNIGDPITTKTYVDDKASLLSSEIEAAKQGIEPFGTKTEMDAFTPGADDPKIAKVMNDSTAGNNGEYRWDGSVWVKRDSLADVKQIKNWVGSETFDSTINMVFSDAGNLQSADLVYLDGIEGTISNLEEDSEGRLTSLRYNRPDDKYITYAVSYDADGIPTPTLTATGY